MVVAMCHVMVMPLFVIRIENLVMACGAAGGVQGQP